MNAFDRFEITHQSGHGSFIMRRLSPHVWVCVAMNENHRFAANWTRVNDYPKPFVVYIGFNPTRPANDPDNIELWVKKLRNRIRFERCEGPRIGKADRTGMPKEARFYGVSAKDTLAIAAEDTMPF